MNDAHSPKVFSSPFIMPKSSLYEISTRHVHYPCLFHKKSVFDSIFLKKNITSSASSTSVEVLYDMYSGCNGWPRFSNVDMSVIISFTKAGIKPVGGFVLEL